MLLFSLATVNSRAQVIRDELTPERDKVFYELECGTNNLALKRVLTVGESTSIRKGRELLVGIDEQNDIIYEFQDIDAYSSLFFESAKFSIHDVNSDGTPELIIEIEPFESSNTIWIYQIDQDCQFSFVNSIIANKYSVESNELIIQTNAVCTYWDDYVNYGYLLGRLDNSLLDKVDFYELHNSKLVKVNSKHQKEMDARVENFKKFLELLAEQESKEDPETINAFKDEYSEVRERLEKVIKDY